MNVPTVEEVDRNNMINVLIELFSETIKYICWNSEKDYSKNIISENIRTFVENLVSEVETRRKPYKEEFGGGSPNEEESSPYIDTLITETYSHIKKHFEKNYTYYIRQHLTHEYLNKEIEKFVKSLICNLQRHKTDTPIEYYYLPYNSERVKYEVDHSFEALKQRFTKWLNDPFFFKPFNRNYNLIIDDSKRMIEAENTLNLCYYGTELYGTKALIRHIQDKQQLSFWIEDTDSKILMIKSRKFDCIEKKQNITIEDKGIKVSNKDIRDIVVRNIPVDCISLSFPQKTETEHNIKNNLYNEFDETSRLGVTTGITLMNAKVITREEFESRNALKTNLKTPSEYENKHRFFLEAGLDSIMYHIQNLEFLKDKVELIEEIRKCLAGRDGKARLLCINPDKFQNVELKELMTELSKYFSKEYIDVDQEESKSGGAKTKKNYNRTNTAVVKNASNKIKTPNKEKIKTVNKNNKKIPSKENKKTINKNNKKTPINENKKSPSKENKKSPSKENKNKNLPKI
jgi:hypothetical protein